MIEDIAIIHIMVTSEADRAARAVLLVASAGGLAPVQHAIRSSRPSSLILVGTKVSWKTLKTAGGVEFGAQHRITLRDEADLTAAVEACRTRLTRKVQEWQEANPSGIVLVDFTGGTKVISAALMLVARAWPRARFQYISGSRLPTGMMEVVSGTEFAVHAANPWEALGYQTAERAVTLFDGGSPMAAVQFLDVMMQNATGEPTHAGSVTAALGLLRRIMEGYSQWDRFEHGACSKAFRECVDGIELLTPLMARRESRRELARRLKDEVAYLAKFSEGKPPTLEMALDLMANAIRRQAESRFDDAVARLYRACEALGQARLHRCGIPPVHGLQATWKALAKAGDPVGVKFQKMGLSGALGARNRSILAHGFQPLGAPDVENLLVPLLVLAETTREHLPLFHKLAPLL